MRILCFGSINIDHVYQVPHLVRSGETLSSRNYQTFAGGKGLNQSIALARAGAAVWHAGKVGPDGNLAMEQLRGAGVDTSLVALGSTASGHAIIQVDEQGSNCILLFGGSNQEISSDEIDRALAKFSPGEFLLIQNEINGIAEIMAKAKARGLRIIFNPAPMTADVLHYPNSLLDYLIVNEIEGSELTGQQLPAEILATLRTMLPHTSIILTLGENGAMYSSAAEYYAVPARQVVAVDTTAAGDTFIGYLIAELGKGGNAQDALSMAAAAAALCVSYPGAAISIPTREEVVAALHS